MRLIARVTLALGVLFLVSIVIASKLFPLFLLAGIVGAFWYFVSYRPSRQRIVTHTIERTIRHTPNPQQYIQDHAHIAQVDRMSGEEFEYFVASLMNASGRFTNVRITGRTGDLGIDIRASNQLGQHFAVQCKRQQSQIASRVVRELQGSINRDTEIGVLVTNSTLTLPAMQWANSVDLTIIDRPKLIEWIKSINLEEAV